VATVTAFERLNPAQREAARFGGRDQGGVFRAGPLLIIAGAGTGKTNTLAHRVAHLMIEGVSPERILLLTFTRRAALEMTRRAQRIIASVLGEKAGAEGRAGAAEVAVKLPWSGTFHSIANRLIRRHAASVGLDANFSVLDRGDAADLMDVVRHELDLSRSEKRFPRKDTCLAIYSHRVNTRGTLANTLAHVFPWCAAWEEELTRLFRAYVERKLAHQALDYDDLLLYWHAMAADPRSPRTWARSSTRSWWTNIRTPTHCRRKSSRRCGRPARASRWWGTMPSRSTRSGLRRWRTFSAFLRSTCQGRVS
jgi:DNA helicase-2/ATP-dependent DNA helicase PcrA